MKEENIFTVLELNGGRKGGDIHSLAREAASNAERRWQQGRLCYKFTLDGVDFDGCFDGWLVTTVPDIVPGFKTIRIVNAVQKTVIEGEIFIGLVD